MKRISSAEFVRSFSHHSDAALTDPVVITHHGATDRPGLPTACGRWGSLSRWGSQ